MVILSQGAIPAMVMINQNDDGGESTARKVCWRLVRRIWKVRQLHFV